MKMAMPGQAATQAEHPVHFSWLISGIEIKVFIVMAFTGQE
jgi:hypothetical protein